MIFPENCFLQNQRTKMNKTVLTKFTPHIAAFLLFVVISFMYFSPVLEGKQLLGHDTESWMYMAKETIDYNATHNDVTLWTNSMFGGMPTYQISMAQPYNLIKYVEDMIHIFPNTVYNLMLYLIGFYILLLAFKVNPWLAIVGAIAFSFASYNFIIILAGHNSKAITIAYMAPLIGSVFMAFRRKRVLGALLTAFFLSLAIRANHVQILYYTVFILIILAVVEFIYSIKDKEFEGFLKTSGMLVAAALIAVGMNATSLLTTNEYSKATMRGESNGLTVDTQNSQHGLNKDYITQWSYGIGETMTLLIPDFNGGGSGGTLSSDSETGKKLTSLGAPDVNKIMKETQFPLYWGTQPFTSGPVYIGAIICFLFVLGFFLVDKRTKWWLLPMIGLTLMLAWGRNFMWLTDIFIDYVPLYNKFRTVSMMLVATGFGMTLMAILALKEVFTEKNKQKLIRPVLISAAIVGGIALIFALIPSLSGDFISPADAQYTGNNAFLKETLPLDRAGLLRADAFRSLMYVILSAGLIWLYAKDYLKQNLMYVLFGILIMFDLAPVAKRYLNNDNFQRPRHFETLITPSKADNFILQDKSQFRVLDGTVNIFNDASPSYFHKNIGGYHAAKLRRYQEMINMHIEKEVGRMFGAFGRATNPQIINNTMDSLGVLNMLNMKYLIYNKESAPLLNPHANGNAWFVNTVRIADNANDEMRIVGEINTKKELVADKSFASQLPAKINAPDTTARIALIKYAPNDLLYSFNSKTDQVAVFSEIYYKNGWNAYINGKIVPYVRANYLLRAMPLKAGNYEIEYKFEPKSYSIGNTIALISSLLLILSIIGYIFLQWKKSRKTALNA